MKVHRWLEDAEVWEVYSCRDLLGSFAIPCEGSRARRRPSHPGGRFEVGAGCVMVVQGLVVELAQGLRRRVATVVGFEALRAGVRDLLCVVSQTMLHRRGFEVGEELLSGSDLLDIDSRIDHSDERQRLFVGGFGPLPFEFLDLVLLQLLAQPVSALSLDRHAQPLPVLFVAAVHPATSARLLPAV